MDSLVEVAAEPAVHPCVRCGACCAFFRVLFGPEEILPESYSVPRDVVEKVDATTMAVIGTNQMKPRCIALSGQIGKSVGCTIYEQRPGCCREFIPSYENGIRNKRCEEARRSKGLKPLRPADFGARPCLA